MAAARASQAGQGAEAAPSDARLRELAALPATRRAVATRVQQQEIPLPSWLANQAVITTLLGEAVEPQTIVEASKDEKLAPTALVAATRAAGAAALRGPRQEDRVNHAQRGRGGAQPRPRRVGRGAAHVSSWSTSCCAPMNA